jgi:predicted dehydrogenase
MTSSASDPEALRVGVVGVGHLGQHHARILGGMPGVKLVAIADTRPVQARMVADKNGTRAVDDYRQLLGEVDAVSIAVPTALHRVVAGSFLEAGIATLVEKPLAATLDEAQQLVAIAESRQTLLQVGHIERFNPALTALEGMVLRPRYLEAERLSTYTFRSTDIGVVLDLMIHDIDLLLALVPSAVKSVHAVGVSVFGGHEDIANARIEFEDGCVANLTASRASYQATRKMRLYGAEGYVSLDFAAKQGTLIRPSEALMRGEIDLEGVDMSQPPAIKERLFGKILRVDRVQTEGREPLALELEEFVRAARGETIPQVTGVEALRAISLADEVLRSLRGHHWAGIDSPAAPPSSHDPGHALRGPISWRLPTMRQQVPVPPPSRLP